MNIFSLGQLAWFEPMDTTTENIDLSNKRERDRRLQNLTKETLHRHHVERPKKCKTVPVVDLDEVDQLVEEIAETHLRPPYDLSKNAEQHNWITRTPDYERLAIHPRASRFMSDELFVHFCRPYPAFTRLSLQHGENITDRGFLQVLEGRSHMQAIDISCCPKITNNTLYAIATHCQDLRHFELLKCPQVTDSGIRALVERCKNLRRISLDWCEGATDASLTAIATYCPMLESLCITEGTQFTLKGLKAVLQGCPWLEKLDLWGCKQVTDAWIDAIIEWAPNIRELELKYCPHVTQQAVTRLKGHFKDLVVK